MHERDVIARLTAETFWDVDRESLMPDRHARFIIVRVMDRGTRAEVDAVMAFYGDAVIREHLLAAPSLDPRTLAYFAAKYALPRHAFRAHQRRHVAMPRAD